MFFIKKLVIFADYGLDDAAATVSILRHHELYDEIIIVPIGGNVPVKVSYCNCLTLLAQYPALLNKIIVVSTYHLIQPQKYLASIHGCDGMGDLLTPPEIYPVINKISFEEWLNTYTGEEIILSLGPMTLVRTALQQHSCKQLIFMGGCVREEPNFNGREFNHALDVNAFAYCVRHPHTAVTLDTCRVERLDIRRIKIVGEDLHARLLRADQSLSISRGENGCYVWDDIAACYLLHPERFDVHKEIDRDGNLLYNARYISDSLYFTD